jgi:hypothetical protein
MEERPKSKLFLTLKFLSESFVHSIQGQSYFDPRSFKSFISGHLAWKIKIDEVCERKQQI